jgi:hypothetical protein
VPGSPLSIRLPALVVWLSFGLRWLRNQTEGRAYYDRKVAAGKTPMEAMRALKRRLSDVVYHQMITDARAARTGPGRTPGGGYWLQRGRLAPQRRCKTHR